MKPIIKCTHNLQTCNGRPAHGRTWDVMRTYQNACEYTDESEYSESSDSDTDTDPLERSIKRTQTSVSYIHWIFQTNTRLLACLSDSNDSKSTPNIRTRTMIAYVEKTNELIERHVKKRSPGHIKFKCKVTGVDEEVDTRTCCM